MLVLKFRITRDGNYMLEFVSCVDFTWNDWEPEQISIGWKRSSAAL